MGHLEDPKLTSDLTMARDFDLGITGPPMFISMDFIASGLVEMIAGLASAVVLAGYRVVGAARCWPAPGWPRTGCCARAASGATGTPRKSARAQRHADYAYRLAVEPPAAKELRLFGLASWIVDRFRARRQRLFELQWQATRLRERPVAWSLLLVLAANLVVFWSLARRGRRRHPAARSRGDLRDGRHHHQHDRLRRLGRGRSTAPPRPSRRCFASRRRWPPPVRWSAAPGRPPACRRARSASATSPSPTRPAGEPVLEGFDLTIPAGSSLAIVGQNGAGKTTLAKLLCRLYDPQAGAIEVDGVDLRELDLDAWRSRVTAVFQDFIRFELPLRDNVAPAGAPDDVIRAALADAGAADLADLDTILARGYEGGTELSGGQWQRVALARALCAVRIGAGVVLLDEPTAQLDVRGEAEIFDRILAATRHTTTILISHRFSTVRHADRICVLEGGRVVELGTHDELMAAGGRYRTMFDLQASRFGSDGDEEEGVAYDVLEA